MRFNPFRVFSSALIAILLVFGAASAFGQAITLSVVYDYVTDAGRISVQNSLDAYQKAHPNIKLDIQVTPQSKWAEVMKTRALSNDLPSVAMAVPQRIAEWAVSNKLLAGNDYIPKAVLDTYAKVRLLPDTYDGKIYGLPFADSSRAVAYNVDYFNKAGIKPPTTDPSKAWTWDEMIAAAKKAQVAGGARYAVQFGKPSMDSWIPFLYEAGGSLMSEDFSRSALNSPEARRALEWTVKLHKDGTAAPGIIDGTEDPLRNFASGLCALWMPTDNSLMKSLDAQMKFEWAFTFTPRDKQAATVIGGSDWIAFKGPYPKEAWDLVLYMASQGPMSDYNAVMTAIPPRNDVKVSWSVHPEYAAFFQLQARQVPDNLLKQQIHPAYAACRDKLLQEVSAAVSGQETVDDALKNMHEIMGQSLKLNHY